MKWTLAIVVVVLLTILLIFSAPLHSSDPQVRGAYGYSGYGYGG